MKKKIGAFGAGQFSLGTLAGGLPGTTIFQNPGGGGGLGGVAYKDRARPPPRGCMLQHTHQRAPKTGAAACCGMLQPLVPGGEWWRGGCRKGEVFNRPEALVSTTTIPWGSVLPGVLLGGGVELPGGWHAAG